MAANDKAGQNRPAQTGNEAAPTGAAPSDAAGEAEALRIRRQTERIREMERLMRAAAAFARGRPPR